MKRVVITGSGTINSIGQNILQTIDSLKEGRCGITDLKFKDVERLSVKIGGQIHDFEPDKHFNRQQLSLYDRYTQLTLLAGKEAIHQSGLTFSGEIAESTGVVLGTAGGGVSTWDDNYRAVYEDRKNRVHPFVVPKLMNNAAASHLSMKYNLKGPTFTVSSACASSNHAMAQAFQIVRSAQSSVMVTGGSESMLCFGGIKAWEGLRVMSKDACRPFSLNRSGMVQGEGAAIFVFEELEHAKRRGADIICEIKGFAMSADAADIVNPSKRGAARAISDALRDARVNVEDVGYINAHGTGTAANDKTECAAVADVFGHHANKIMISSTKSMHGHIIGGTGAVEIVPCILALREGVIAPTIGYQEHDPECALDVVPNEARDAKVNVAISNAFAFGGLNAVLVLQKI